ncbi:unnamed protein product, partial [Mesorhabditis belari]|uniref:Intraflagellar transport protein 57 homolog n=1 Tax=Mesorhabditis belari TaxID=2138241 RepID=A0AAF3F745_9BILA
MAEEEDEEPIGELAEGPGKEFEIYLKSEDMVEKLKLLNYEEGFLKLNKAYRAIQRHYFVRSTNVGEQFFLFTSLAAWLIRKCGNEQFELPQEFDDPNTTITNIVTEVRAKGIAADFSSSKLKSGSGEQVLFVLDKLCDTALVNTGFSWQKMVPPVNEDEDMNVDSEKDSDSEGVPDDEIDVADDDDDNAILVDLAAPIGADRAPNNPQQDLLKSSIDAQSWKTEVERVTPQLKITIRQDAKDWRMHLEQMHSMHTNMEDLIAIVTPQLGQITSELDKSLERIETREKNLNQQLSGLISKFRQSQDSRAEAVQRYKTASVGITERESTLQRISDDLDQIKQQIEEEGQKNSDGAPLVKVKQALLKIEEDIQKMNVQIGVLEQALLNAHLRERVAFAQEAYGAY